MFEKKAETAVSINDQLALRWSGRAYDPARRVDRIHILALLEAARWAPSCYGDQPWRYVVCNRDDNRDAWQRALDCLVPGNQSWARHAPILILVAADNLFQHNSEPNRWAQYDTGAASMSLCVQATGLGLMVHQMGGFDAQAATAAFGLPQHCTPMAMMAVGYQLAQDQIPDDLREREIAARKRRPIAECFFDAEWGRGFTA